MAEQQEPYERLTVDVEENHQGTIMEKLGERRGGLAKYGSRWQRACASWII